MPGYIHHIEWAVGDVSATVDNLVRCYGFKQIAGRDDNNKRQVALKSGKTVFLITDRSRAAQSSEGWPVFSSNKSLDSLFNVCLEVGELRGILDRVRRLNPKLVILEPRTVSDTRAKYGHVTVAAIKSCVGNVIHTLVNTKNYCGAFLPGFESSMPDGDPALSPKTTSHMDHVTYVCDEGESEGILQWYAELFGMRRFLVNRAENVDEGIVIGEEVGMRMKVGEWLSAWLCREQGVQMPKQNGKDLSEEMENFKLVLAEPLEGAADSHVRKFLDAHGGPGLQHIGLSTCNVESTVEAMAECGAQFRRPPPTYYKMESKVSEILGSGRSLDTFQRLGLLLDSEADVDIDENGHYDSAVVSNNGHQDSNKPKALIQIFTKPLFAEDTFFLEVLERDGARGFGAGNITALARSIQLHQSEMAEKLKRSSEQ